MSEKTIKVKQVKSAIGRLKSHQACLRGLGIHRMHQSVCVSASPENLGMVKKISYMLEVEEA
jgi:large subunit ribosomal protein L30